MTYRRSKSTQSAFTFVELVIVIAVVGIMTALAIGSFANGAQDAREIVARQQQAALQTAVNAWVSSQLTTSSTVKQVRTTYNAAVTSEARLTLIKDYLDAETYDHFWDQDLIQPSDEISSEATRKLGWHISLPDWASSSYPKVSLDKEAP